MMSYYLEFAPNDIYKREMIRKVMLVVSIVIDLVAISLFVMAIFSPLYFIGVACLLVLSNVIRYIVNLYPKRYKYGVNDCVLSIMEISPLRTKLLISVEIKDINSIEEINNKPLKIIIKDINNIILYDNSCQKSAYMIIFNGKSVILPLDEYMYTLIKGYNVKED